MKLLVTGFEPFGGETVNPASLIVSHLSAPENTELFTRIIPVTFARGREIMIECIRQTRADTVISIGQAGNRPGITPEMIGVNLMSTRSADGTRLGADDHGFIADDLPIRSDGPAAYFSTLSARDMVHACRQAGIDAAVSMTAGSFVCNFTLYTLLDLACTEFPGMRAGFIHVPYLPEQLERIGTGSGPAYAMELDDMVRGVQAMIDAIAN